MFKLFETNEEVWQVAYLFAQKMIRITLLFLTAVHSHLFGNNNHKSYTIHKCFFIIYTA